MSEGPEYQPGQAQGDEHRPPSPQFSKGQPRGLGRLVPSSLRDLFAHKPKTVEPSHVAAENVPEHTIEISTPVFDTRATTSALERLATGQGLMGEEGASPIHPDIEEGARHILEEELAKMVRTGNTAGIEIGIRSLANAWQQAQKAAGIDLELTPEGRQEIPDKVRQLCAEYLQEGLGRVFSVTEYEVRNGQIRGITYEPGRVDQIFRIADEFQIPLAYLPNQEGTDANDTHLPAVAITTREQAAIHIQQVIDRNLPRGMQGIIDALGSQVGKGLLEQLPRFEARIKEWIGIMEERGWTVTDQPVEPVMGEAQSGLLPRQVNRAEIRQLVDQAVRDNLAKGARHISEMVGFNIKSGWFDPLKTWGSPENIALYTEAGERYGLTHHGALVGEMRDDQPSLYFDPRELPRHIQDAVRKNLPDGLRAIEVRHLTNVTEGRVGQIEFGERTLEQYIALASQYGVHSNADKLRAEMSGHLTADNLRKGVSARVKAGRDALRKANYNDVSVHVREAEEFRKFVHERGFDGKVDFSELDRYLKETATQAPRLTERTA